MTDYKNLPEADEMALWNRTSKNGKQYLSGFVTINGNKIKVVAFVNEKTKDTQPDFSFKKPNQTQQVRQDINEQNKIQSDINNFNNNQNGYQN